MKRVQKVQEQQACNEIGKHSVWWSVSWPMWSVPLLYDSTWPAWVVSWLMNEKVSHNNTPFRGIGWLSSTHYGYKILVFIQLEYRWIRKKCSGGMLIVGPLCTIVYAGGCIHCPRRKLGAWKRSGHNRNWQLVLDGTLRTELSALIL